MNLDEHVVFNDLFGDELARDDGKTVNEFLQDLRRILKSVDRDTFNKYWKLDLVTDHTEKMFARYRVSIQSRLPRNERLHHLPDGTLIILAYKTRWWDPAIDDERKKGFWFSSWYMGRNLEEAACNIKRKIKTFRIYPFRVRLVLTKGLDPVTKDWQVGYWKPVWSNTSCGSFVPFCGSTVGLAADHLYDHYLKTWNEINPKFAKKKKWGKGW